MAVTIFSEILLTKFFSLYFSFSNLFNVLKVSKLLLNDARLLANAPRSVPSENSLGFQPEFAGPLVRANVEENRVVLR